MLILSTKSWCVAAPSGFWSAISAITHLIAYSSRRLQFYLAYEAKGCTTKNGLHDPVFSRQRVLRWTPVANCKRPVAMYHVCHSGTCGVGTEKTWVHHLTASPGGDEWALNLSVTQTAEGSVLLL